MKKIVNWSFGAFFRTIGRTLAYLLVGALITLICLKSDKLKSLLFMSVNASTSPKYWITNTDVPTYFDLFDCTESTCNRVNSENYTNQLIELGEVGGREFTVTTRQYNLQGNGIVMRTSSNSRYNVGYLYQTTFYVCSDAVMDNATNTIYPSYYGDAFTNNNVFQSSNSYNLSGVPGLAPTWSNCYAFSTIFSPGENGTYINLRLKSTSRINGYYALVGFKSESLGLYSGEVKSIVENSGFATATSVEEVKQATNEVKEETKKTNDTLNDDDTTEADSKITGFFNDFSDNSHGLSSIVTAPLNAVNAMLSTTCTAPTATYKGSTFSLPCGSILWEREGADNFKLLLNLFYGGLICYGIIKSLFKDVNDLKNPDNDKVEVLNL